MKKYRFTTEQRFAIWRVYGKKCFYCEQPLTFKEVTIDHIIPEFILDDAEKLQVIKNQYGLNTNFSINDYCNWVPAHFHCNRDKGTSIYPITPTLIMFLEKVQRKGEQAKEEEDRIKRNLKSGDMLGKLAIALKKGVVLKDDVMVVLSSIPPQQEHYEPIVVTFSLNINEMLRKDLQTTELPKITQAYVTGWKKTLLNYSVLC